MINLKYIEEMKKICEEREKKSGIDFNEELLCSDCPKHSDCRNLYNLAKIIYENTPSGWDIEQIKNNYEPVNKENIATKQDLLNDLEKAIYDANNENIQHELADVFNHIKENSADLREAQDYIFVNQYKYSGDVRAILYDVMRNKE